MPAFAPDHPQGSVDDRVERELGCATTQSVQLLAGVLDRPEVAEAEPEPVGALRELRDRRRRSPNRPRLPERWRLPRAVGAPSATATATATKVPG